MTALGALLDVPADIEVAGLASDSRKVAPGDVFFALAGAKDDDMWAVVAFVKKLPGVSEADYKTWTASAPNQ